jgi:hypothetical protein
LTVKTSFFDECLGYLDCEGMKLEIESIPGLSKDPSLCDLYHLASDYVVGLRSYPADDVLEKQIEILSVLVRSVENSMNLLENETENVMGTAGDVSLASDWLWERTAHCPSSASC